MQQLTQKPNFVPLEVFAPTGIQTFDLCPRKWGFKALDGWRAPQAPGQAFGTEVHRILETYYKGGPLLANGDAGAVALAMVPYLPNPSDCDAIETERSVNIQVPFRINSESKRDLAVCIQGAWGVYDYKSTKDLKYALTPEQLLVDPQAVIYALDVVINREADQVDARWVYGQKPPKKVIAKPVDALMTKAHVMTEWDRMCQESLRPMSSLVRAKRDGSIADANALTPNWDACKAYGGCEFSAAKGGPCQQSTQLGYRLGDQIMSQPQRPGVADMLAQRRAAAGQVGGMPPQAQPPYQQPGAPPPGYAPGPPPGAAPMQQPPYQPPPQQQPPQGPPPGYQPQQQPPPGVHHGGPPGGHYQPPPQAYGQPGHPGLQSPEANGQQQPGAPYVPPQGPPPGAPPGAPQPEAPKRGRPAGASKKDEMSDVACAAIGFVQGCGSELVKAGVSAEQIAVFAAAFGKALVAELAK